MISMKKHIDVTSEESSVLLRKTFIIFVLSLLFLAFRFNSSAQFGLGGTNIDARVYNTYKVSTCGFPLRVSNTSPLAGQTVNWKVIKGEINPFGALNSSFLTINDMRRDTCILVYSTLSGTTVVNTDTLLLSFENFGCFGKLIDRGGPPLNAKCGDTITLRTSLDPFTYNFFWSGNNIQFITPVYGTEVRFIVKAAGSFDVNLNATSKFFSNTSYDNYYSTATCGATITKANAGPDRSITYCDLASSFRLAGNAPAAGETGRWSAAGSTSIMLTNATLPDTRVPDARDGTYRMVWTISNGVTTSSDTVTLTILPTTDCPVANAGPDVTANCGDTITLTGAGHVGEERGRWYVVSGNITILNTTSSTTKAVVNAAGNIQVEYRVYSRAAYRVKSDVKIINATCIPSVTKANAGPDQYITACMFPLPLFGNAPKAGETVKWRVLEGQAYFDFDNLPMVRVLDARGIPDVKLTYTISNGSASSIDTMVIRFNSLNCNLMLSNPGQAECGDTLTLSLTGMTLPSQSNALWTISSGLWLLSSDLNQVKVVVAEGGTHTVSVLVHSAFNLHQWTASSTFTAVCPLIQAYAGEDDTIYCNTNSGRLNAGYPQAGETGHWEVLSGDVTINDMNDAHSYFRPTKRGIIELVWHLSNGTNNSSDTVRIVSDILQLDEIIEHNASCGKSDGSIELNVSGGKAPYQFIIDGNWPRRDTLTGLAKGSHSLIIMDSVYCVVWSNFTIEENICLPDTITVEGDIKRMDGMQQYGLVMLIQKVGTVPVPVKSVHIVNGHYKFNDVKKGTYYVYSIPFMDEELEEVDDSYLPTYYVNKLEFTSANAITVVGDTYSVDIRLITNFLKPVEQNSLRMLTGTVDQLIQAMPALIYNMNDEIVSWTSCSSNAAVFESLDEGDYYVMMPVENKGYIKSDIVHIEGNVEAVINGTTSVNGKSLMASAKVYPNPFKEQLRIELPADIKGNVQVSVLNYTTGQILKTADVDASAEISLDTESLNAGMYLLKIETENLVRVMLIEKQK